MTTVTSSHLKAVYALAKRAAALRPKTADEIALVAFMTGALYSIRRSIEYDFDDSRMAPDLPAMASEVTAVLGDIALSKEPGRAWLSGFYIDSAMMRLAALGDRLGKHVGPKRPLAPFVPDAVNSMKHDVDAGIAAGWRVRFDDVLKAAEDLSPLLLKAVP